MPPAGIASLTHGPDAARGAALRCRGSPGAYGLLGSVRYGGSQLRKQKSGRFCNFFAIGALFRLCKTEAGYRAVVHLRFCSVELRLDALKQSPSAKKLQPRPVFVSGPLRWARGGAGLAHVALVTHGKESNAMGGAGLALSVEWRVSHFLPLLPLKRANGAVFLKIDGLMLRFMAKM